MSRPELWAAFAASLSLSACADAVAPTPMSLANGGAAQAGGAGANGSTGGFQAVSGASGASGATPPESGSAGNVSSGGMPAAGGSGGGGVAASAGAASGGAGDPSGGTAGSAGAPMVRRDPPQRDTKSTLPIAAPGAGYVVEGNLPYGENPRQRLDVMYPKGEGPQGKELLPGVIMFHGGGWIQGDKATMASFFSRFLKHGFVVCSVEYRVADGSPGGAVAPAAVQDALLAAKWFWDYLDYYHVDRNKYVVSGASAGGHLALMVGMATNAAALGPTHPGDFRIAAIVNGYGPTDVSDLLRRGTSFAVQWLPATVPDRAALAQRLSPVTYARKDIPPLITVHGSADTTVPVAQATQLEDALRAVGAESELHFIAGAAHGFSTPASAWPSAEQAMFDFLKARGLGK